MGRGGGQHGINIGLVMEKEGFFIFTFFFL